MLDRNKREFQSGGRRLPQRSSRQRQRHVARHPGVSHRLNYNRRESKNEPTVILSAPIIGRNTKSPINRYRSHGASSKVAQRKSWSPSPVAFNSPLRSRSNQKRRFHNKTVILRNVSRSQTALSASKQVAHRRGRSLSLPRRKISPVIKDFQQKISRVVKTSPRRSYSRRATGMQSRSRKRLPSPSRNRKVYKSRSTPQKRTQSLHKRHRSSVNKGQKFKVRHSPGGQKSRSRNAKHLQSRHSRYKNDLSGLKNLPVRSKLESIRHYQKSTAPRIKSLSAKARHRENKSPRDRLGNKSNNSRRESSGNSKAIDMLNNMLSGVHFDPIKKLFYPGENKTKTQAEMVANANLVLAEEDMTSCEVSETGNAQAARRKLSSGSSNKQYLHTIQSQLDELDTKKKLNKNEKYIKDQYKRLLLSDARCRGSFKSHRMKSTPLVDKALLLNRNNSALDSDNELSPPVGNPNDTAAAMLSDAVTEKHVDVTAVNNSNTIGEPTTSVDAKNNNNNNTTPIPTSKIKNLNVSWYQI